MSPRRKQFLFLAGIGVAVLILLAVYVLPRLVDVNRYRPEVEARLQAETGKPVRIGHLALTLFPTASIRVDDFQIGNPQGFPSGRLLSVKTIYAVVSLGALLHRVVKITSLDLENVKLNLLSSGHGNWNYQNHPDAPSASTPSPGRRLFTLGTVSNIRIEHGQWSIADVLPSNREGPPYLKGTGISTEISKINLGVWGGGSADVFATPGPAGWLFPVAEAAERSPAPAAEGTLKAKSLRFGTVECTGFKSEIRIYRQKILLDNMGTDIDGGRAQGTLALDFSGSHLRYASRIQMHGVDIARALASDPQGRGKMTGTLDGSMQLSGEITSSANPLLNLTGRGQLRARHGTLPSLQLNKNLMLLARVARLGPAAGNPSSFSSISADLDIAGGILRTKKIVVVGNGVDVDGSGLMALTGPQKLDYAGMATLAAGQTALTNLLAGLLGGSYNNGKLSFPFTLKGTLSNPRFILKALGTGLGNLTTPSSGGTSGSSSPGSTQRKPGLWQTLQSLFAKPKQSATQPQAP